MNSPLVTLTLPPSWRAVALSSQSLKVGPAPGGYCTLVEVPGGRVGLLNDNGETIEIILTPEADAVATN